jgi:predicted transcriptional regulator
MAEEEDKGKPVTFRADPSLVRLAKSLAAARDETLSQVPRRALRTYVNSGPTQTNLLDAADAAEQESRRKR